MDAPRVAMVALGSNVGDARATVLSAIESLRALSDEPIAVSSLWQTAPVDCPPGSACFVNAVVALQARAEETPESLLLKLQELERQFGRQPKKVLNEPRPLDLDLIAFGMERRNTPLLTLPHPRAHLRRFVLEPLAEIRPELLLPGQRERVSELLRRLPFDECVAKLPG